MLLSSSPAMFSTMLSRSPVVTNVLIVGWVLICVAAGWVALALFGAGVEWAGETGRAALQASVGKSIGLGLEGGLIVGLMVAGLLWVWRFNRREFRRQYERDRTIHIEQRPPPKPRGTYLVPIGALVAAFALIAALATMHPGR